MGILSGWRVVLEFSSINSEVANQSTRGSAMTSVYFFNRFVVWHIWM